MKKLKLLATPFLVALLLTACSGETNIATQDLKEMVNDFSVGTKKDQSASITSTHLIVTSSNGDKTEYDLSEEDFFISIAPFINETHP